MNLKRFASVLPLVAVLSACSSEASHPICKDEKSTTDYGVKWQEDLAAAKAAGKVTMDQVVQFQGKIYEKLAMLTDQNWSGWCNFIDGVRTDGGFQR